MSSLLPLLRRSVGRYVPARVVHVLMMRQHRKVLLDSGLFDESWYRAQPGVEIGRGEDAAMHYVRTGKATAASPHPCFAVEWYVAQRGVSAKRGSAPFVHYLMYGAPALISPHPLFDPKWYVSQRPDARSWRGGALKHYLDLGWREGVAPSPAVPVEQLGASTERAPLLDWISATEERLAEARNFEGLPRSTPTFDRVAARAVLKEGRDLYEKKGSPRPLVSVVIPTKDRVESLLVAVRSVMAQTYENWELVVVDDGSTDDTVERLRTTIKDPRLRVVVSPVNVGVSKARNLGLREISGDYVAYLDSDNTWDPGFLQSMIENVVGRGARFGYGISELVEEGEGGKHAFRAMGFNREALFERNYIDCIVVLHERSLLEEVGQFDETLRRNVDWDLFIRFARVTDFLFVPFVGTVYDAWEERADRITVNEKFGYRYVIQAKRLLDWTAADPGDAAGRPEVSVIVHVSRSATGATKLVEHLLETLPEQAELILVDSRLSEPEARLLLLLENRDPRVTVLRQRQPYPLELSRNIGALAATGKVLIFVAEDLDVDGSWVAPLVESLRRPEIVAVQPRILALSGTTWSSGVVIAKTGDPVQFLQGVPGDSPEALEGAQRQGLSSRCIAVRRSDFVSVQGFDNLYVNDADGCDLSLRLARSGDGRGVLRYEPDSLVWLTRRVVRPAKLAVRDRENARLFSERWMGLLSVDADSSWRRAGYDVLGYERSGHTLGGFEMRTHRRRSGGRLRWAIKIGPEDVSRRKNWGDWHFANSLKDSLERLGHEVVVDCKDAWHRSTAGDDDVVLVLRGVSRYRVNPSHVNLLWVISHPDRVVDDELGDYDNVFVASNKLAKEYSDRLGSRVGSLLQCADSRLFRPVATDVAERHDVLFVGNARGVRPSVAASLEAGIVPSVFGVRWEGLLPEGAHRGVYVPNDALPALYGAAGVVLNDHWEDMARDGLLSNRLFDLAACGARIVSDRAVGVEEVFGDIVLTYESAEELASAVATHLDETPERRASRLEFSEYVREHHSFDARAIELSEAVSSIYPEK